MIVEFYVIGLIISFIGALVAKKNLFAEIIVLSIILYLMGRGADTLDTLNYKITYEQSVGAHYSDSYEKLYLLLQKVGNYFNLNYIQFRYVLLLCSWILIRSTITRLSYNPGYIYFFYLLFAVIIDTVQLRSFIAFSLIVFGLRFLLQDSRKAGYRYLTIVLFATMIHISSLLYLVLLFVKKPNPAQLLKPILFVTIVLCVFIFLFGNRIPFLNEIMISLENERLTHYTKRSTQLGFLYPMLIHCYNLFLVFCAYKLGVNKGHYVTSSANTLNAEKVLAVILWINVVAVVFFPLYMYNVQFIRLTRNLLLFNLIAFSIVQVPFLRLNYRLILLNGGVALSIFFWYYFTFVVQDHIEDIITPFFDSKTIRL